MCFDLIICILHCMKTGRPRFRLAIESDRLTEVETLYRKTKDVRVKERAQTILLAADGDHSYERIAQTVGQARSSIQRWIAAFEREGIYALYSRQGRGGGRPNPMKDAEVKAAFEQKLKEGAW
jgi:transposase